VASSGQATKYPFNTRLTKREALWGTPRYGNRDTALKTWQSDYFFGSAAPSGANVSSNKSYGAVTGTGTLTVLITVSSNKSYGAVTGTGSLTVLITVTSSKTYGAVTGTATLTVSGGVTPTLPQNVYLRPIQVLVWRVIVQDQTYFVPFRNYGLRHPPYQKTFKAFVPNTGLKFPSYQRRFVIINPTDS
jgi:hypothetical protein